jgi:transposase
MTSDTPFVIHDSAWLPICPRCRTKTTLARVILDKPGFETRTFKCPDCGFEISELAKYE